MSLQIPSVQPRKSVQEFIRVGNVFALYDQSGFKKLKIKNYMPFRLKVVAQIPAGQLQLTVTAQGGINPNPLYLIYTTPSSMPVLYLFGISWNSPFVELFAKDPAGTPYWQIGPNFETPVYLEGDIYDPLVWFGGINNRTPTLIFQRRTQSAMIPAPPSLPIVFTISFIGYAIKYEDLGKISEEEVNQMPFVVWLYSQNPAIFTTG